MIFKHTTVRRGDKVYVCAKMFFRERMIYRTKDVEIKSSNAFTEADKLLHDIMERGPFNPASLARRIETFSIAAPMVKEADERLLAFLEALPKMPKYPHR